MWNGIEMVPIAGLKPHPRNYRKHGEEQLKHIIASLKSSGFYRNIIIAKDDTILAGHGVVLACEKMGIASIPVVRLDLDPFDPKALKVLTGDNEISRGGDVDDRLLSEILRDIAHSSDGLLGTGFDENQLAAFVMVTRHEDEIKDFNAAKEWVGLPIYQEEDSTEKDELIIRISFKSDKDRQEFVEKTHLQIASKQGNRVWSTKYPFEDRKDPKSIKFEGAE